MFHAAYGSLSTMKHDERYADIVIDEEKFITHFITLYMRERGLKKRKLQDKSLLQFLGFTTGMLHDHMGLELRLRAVNGPQEQALLDQSADHLPGRDGKWTWVDAVNMFLHTRHSSQSAQSAESDPCFPYLTAAIASLPREQLGLNAPR